MAHFNFQVMTRNGSLKGEPIRCKTEAGVILQCPHNMDVMDIKHMCAIARQTPDYPVDLALWEGPEGIENLVWSARISYDTGNTGIHKIRRQAG